MIETTTNSVDILINHLGTESNLSEKERKYFHEDQQEDRKGSDCECGGRGCLYCLTQKLPLDVV
jgi:hypothetical protein